MGRCAVGFFGTFWDMCARVFLSLLGVVLLGGCAGIPRGFHAVWTLPFPPPADLDAPAGFTVTPAQAFQIARDSRQLSLKHLWHLYADANHYFVHDSFPGVGAHRAYKQSLHIDGRTGKVVKHWKPPHE